MIVVDTGPLVALFDPRDRDHAACRDVLAGLREELVTTVPVLTETWYLLRRQSIGLQRLRAFVLSDTLTVDFLDTGILARGLALMQRYEDLPMSFADASVIAVAESRGTNRVFTLDVSDFSCYRVRRGQRSVGVDILDGRAN